MLRQIVSLILVLVALPVAAAEVPYPAGYRAFKHVKTMVIEPGHPLYDSFGGIHHIYANGKAMQGYRDGRFPDGAVLVFDLLEARRDNNAVVEGARKVVGVMVRDARRWPDTGGWGFEAFKDDGRTRLVGSQAKEACFNCHTGEGARDFVFSRYRP